MSDEILHEILSEVKALRAEWREVRERCNIGVSNKYVIGGMPLDKWLKKNNPEIDTQTFYNRIRRGWTIEKAAKTPNMRKEKHTMQVSEDDLAAWKESLKNEKSK